MELLLKRGLKLWQGFAGRDTQLERVLRRHYRALRSSLARELVGENYVLFWGRHPRARRVGIYIKGACHLQAIFGCKEIIRRHFNGTCCILAEGEIAGSRSDLILQTLQEIPREHLAEILRILNVPENYFRPTIFEPLFTVQGVHGAQQFEKSVVFFSIGPDVVRNLYRHRDTGILIDPGGWWLTQPMERVLGNLSAVEWFRKHFENIGRIDVQSFVDNYARIIRILKERAGAYVVVFNVPTVEPGKLVHNYQFIRDPLVRRTREFNIALAELSRKLDFPIVDLDRLVRAAGIGAQKDFAHFAPELAPRLAHEAFAVMDDLRVF